MSHIQPSEETPRMLSQTATLQRQAELLNLSNDAIFVRSVDTSEILYWNRGAENLYGWDREEALGRPSHELLHTEFPRSVEEIASEVLETGRWEGILVHMTRDGRRLSVMSRWALQNDDSGGPFAFLEINTDITERLADEARVRALNEELQQRVAELARANAEISRRHRELEAVNTSMTTISRVLDLSHVLQTIVESARELIGARYAALGVADGHGRITQFLTSGITPEQRAEIGPLPQGHGLLGLLIREAKPLRVANIAQHPESHGFPPNHPPMTGLLGVPILLNDQPIGDLYLTDKIGGGEFSEEDENLLMVLANHAAIAIQNARLYEEARSTRDQLKRWNRELEARVQERTEEIQRVSRELTTRVLAAQEDERKRIARELHDETAQSLTTLLITLDMLRPSVPSNNVSLNSGLARLQTLARRTLDEVRALSHDLRPTILDDVGLVAAIEWYADEHTRTFGMPVEVEITPAREERLPGDVETGIFRIFQEALMNAGKYSDATTVRVSLSVEEEDIALRIEDNGRGFNPNDLKGPTKQGGLGLYGMRERAALLGAQLAIDSAPEAGTRVTLIMPHPTVRPD